MKHYGQNCGGAISLQVFSILNITRYLLVNKLKTATNIVDATAGNGRDTLFLAQNSSADATIWAFDIQEAALHKTKQLLIDHQLISKVQLILDSHIHIGRHITGSIDLAMFNLGYLPGASHEITTNYLSTIEAVQQVLDILNVGGVISIVAYPGHAEGCQENDALQRFFLELPANIFTVNQWQIINHVNSPPVFYLIEKVRS